MMKHSVVHAYIIGLLLLICCMAASSALADLDVYYLDVGQADSTLLVCDGHALLIDGGNTDDAEKIVTMITDRIGTHALDAVIATHPHEDHIGGLKAVLNTFKVGTLYSPVIEYDGYHLLADNLDLDIFDASNDPNEKDPIMIEKLLHLLNLAIQVVDPDL